MIKIDWLGRLMATEPLELYFWGTETRKIWKLELKENDEIPKYYFSELVQITRKGFSLRRNA